MEHLEPNEIERVSIHLSKIPGVGFKSARRFAIWLGQNKTDTQKLIEALNDLVKHVTVCKKCFNLTTSQDRICNICKSEDRDRSTICVVQSLENLLEIEEAGVYNGLYFVLGGVISPLYNTEEITRKIEFLKSRVDGENFKEVILVLSSTTEGELTIQYIKEQLKDKNVKISKVASGVPVGANINYVDKKTLSEALKSRVYIQ